MAADHIDWEDLRLLLAASRVASLSELAREMNIDATTASRRLKSLEIALDIPLFTRIRGKLLLTEQAQYLVRHSENMEQAGLALRMEAQKLKDAPEGIVRVSAPPTLARYALAPGIARLSKHNPGLSVELEIAPVNVRLDRWEADIAVRLGPPLDAHGALLARRIGRAGYAVFAPTNQRGPQRWIAYPERFAHLPEAQWIESNLNGAVPFMRVNDPLAMAQAVASGAGRALLPILMGSTFPGIEQQGATVLHREIWLLRHPDSGLTSLVQIVCEWLADLVSATA